MTSSTMEYQLGKNPMDQQRQVSSVTSQDDKGEVDDIW